jgi:hypothetical protein
MWYFNKLGAIFKHNSLTGRFFLKKKNTKRLLQYGSQSYQLFNRQTRLNPTKYLFLHVAKISQYIFFSYFGFACHLKIIPHID